MEENGFNGNKFDLSQNSFVIFMFSYAPGLIIGDIIIGILGSYIPDLLEKILFVLLFVVMLIKAIMDLQLNKRVLVITDDAIMIYLRKRHNNILLKKIDNSEILSINQIDDEGFEILKKDGEKELLALSCSLKPYKVLIYSVKAALFKIYGVERTDFTEDAYFKEYLDKQTLPKQLMKEDSTSKASRLALVIIYIIFAGLPTLIAILAVLMFILQAIMVFLQELITILK